MAVPLRKVVNGYSDYNYNPYVPSKAASKRIIKKNIHSKSEYRQSIVLIFSSMAIVLFLLGMSYIFVKAGVTRINWQVNHLISENQNILMENERIKGEIANKRSLERIEEIAIHELGMVKDSKIEYMVLSDTVVAQGKIKTLEAESKETQETPSPVAAIIDFFLAWKK